MTTPSRRPPPLGRRIARLGVGAALVLATLTGAGAASAAPESAPGVKGDGVFTIAVLPDTQQEVLDPSDPRFTNRAQWLAANKAALDLRYVTHSGDVVNWDTDDHAQYQVTTPGVRLLTANGIPWSFSIGNHDSMATGEPGGARPGGNPSVDVRVTNTFNSYFGVSRATDLRGTWQAGKVDNSYSTFTAEGHKWLVLNLELWPRTGAVKWAQQVVANHADFNVIVVTHAMLNADGTVQQDDGGYGANSPQYVLDNLVRKYANVRFVFSGHVGDHAQRDITGVHGNPISMIQTAYHSNDTNPTRLVTIYTTQNRYTSKVYAPYTKTTYTDGSAGGRTGMAWV